MAWTSFLLGAPGYEFTFEVPPEAMSIDVGDVKVLQPNLAGDLKKSVIKTGVPKIQLKSSYLSITQLNQFYSLRQMVNNFLSFKCRNDFSVFDQVTVLSTTSVQLNNNSATRLSATLVAAGFSSQINVAGTFYYGPRSSDTPFTPGATVYTDSTRIITFANTLPSPSFLFVPYTYSGWLVEMTKFTPANKGGWVDRSTYDIELTGA